MPKLRWRRGKLPEGIDPKSPAMLIATWFGAGLFPVATGTVGSLGAIPFAIVFGLLAGNWGLGAASVVTLLAGIWASGRLVRQGAGDDPNFVVIDEVAGQLLTLALSPLSPAGFVLGFFLFRAADIGKPFPASWCEQHLPGGFGIMLDDIVAGIYAGLACWLLAWLGVIDAFDHFLLG